MIEFRFPKHLKEYPIHVSQTAEDMFDDFISLELVDTLAIDPEQRKALADAINMVWDFMEQAKDEGVIIYKD